MQSAMLKLVDLQTLFKTRDGIVRAVNGVNLNVNYGETVSIVGESGCGKSVTLLSILRIVQIPPGNVNGKILFEGQDLLELSNEEMRNVRGNKIAMVFQEPMTSLHPVFTVGDQIMEVIALHQKVSKKEAKDRAIEMLHLVSVPDAEKRIHDYPHHMSGGMRQRVMIAMALSCRPKLLLADEPTTALDTTIQAQILDLICRLKAELEMAVLLVTHDLGVVAETTQRVAIMYAGRLVERGDVSSIFSNPLHPYTEGLLTCVPRIDEDLERLRIIKGFVPNPISLPKGCHFHPRCPYGSRECRELEPVMQEVAPNHFVACHSAGKKSVGRA